MKKKSSVHEEYRTACASRAWRRTARPTSRLELDPTNRLHQSSSKLHETWRRETDSILFTDQSVIVVAVDRCEERVDVR